MSGSMAGSKMGSMNSEVKHTGSLKLNAAAEQATINLTWKGERPQCSERVEFGYTGYVSVHEPPRTGGRPDERLHHVQARVADVAIADHPP
jgi:hypothetical protein